jgi:hypothetical protein
MTLAGFIFISFVCGWLLGVLMFGHNDINL